MTAGSTEPAGDVRIVMRPDGPEVIRVRVIRRMFHGEGPHAPTTPHVRLHQSVDDASSAIRWHDATGQAVSGIGSDTFDRPLLAIEAKVVGAFLFPPEALVEFLVEANGAIPHLAGLFLLAPDLVRL